MDNDGNFLQTTKKYKKAIDFSTKLVYNKFRCLREFSTATKMVQGLVVQLVRTPPCHGGGRGFESHPGRQFRIIILIMPL